MSRVERSRVCEEMKKPLFFSVVIPTYNREKYILNTLSTVFEQTYPHYEVIVVNNCSTDDTERVLEPLVESKKIKFINLERDFERAYSRNTGMENARGDFLTLLDSDDFMYPTNLEDAAAFALENPQMKFFHNLYELVDEQKNVIQRQKFPPLNDPLKTIVAGNFLSCIGTFLHREIYTKYRFDTFRDLSGAEDWEFWLRVFADYKIGRISKFNNAILHHEDRSIKNQSIESLERGYLHLFDKYRRDPHLSKVYAAHLNRIEANSYLYLAILANSGALFDEAKKYLRLAARKDFSVVSTGRFLRVLRRAVFKLKIK